MELDNSFIGIIVSSLVVMCGWIYTSYLARLQKRKEIRINYLIKAYESIVSTVLYENISTQRKGELERAIDSMQLLGNRETLNNLQNMINKGENDFSGILHSLRNDLRKELGINKTDQMIRHYRLSK